MLSDETLLAGDRAPAWSTEYGYPGGKLALVRDADRYGPLRRLYRHRAPGRWWRESRAPVPEGWPRSGCAVVAYDAPIRHRAQPSSGDRPSMDRVNAGQLRQEAPAGVSTDTDGVTARYHLRDVLSCAPPTGPLGVGGNEIGVALTTYAA